MKSDSMYTQANDELAAADASDGNIAGMGNPAEFAD
jgi:hypothetical protein